MVFGFTNHSNNYAEDGEYMTPDHIEDLRDLRKYIRNVNNAAQHRANDSSIMKAEMADKSFPAIVMGGFNKIGGSKGLRILEGFGLKDAWWKGGCGYGATIHKPLQ